MKIKIGEKVVIYVPWQFVSPFDKYKPNHPYNEGEIIGLPPILHENPIFNLPESYMIKDKNGENIPYHKSYIYPESYRGKVKITNQFAGTYGGKMKPSSKKAWKKYNEA